MSGSASPFLPTRPVAAPPYRPARHRPIVGGTPRVRGRRWGPGGVPFGVPFGVLVRAAWRALVTAWRRHRSRARIAGLDAHLLKDIGVTFAEAEHEANKPFWHG